MAGSLSDCRNRKSTPEEPAGKKKEAGSWMQLLIMAAPASLELTTFLRAHPPFFRRWRRSGSLQLTAIRLPKHSSFRQSITEGTKKKEPRF
ncbi:MAG TPA: hypothetical protein IAB22_04780 [Candidatus Merdivicinus intestinavium]|nr:hypothetical protein [Candidatus Merdivicinus intestinavium]